MRDKKKWGTPLLVPERCPGTLLAPLLTQLRHTPTLEAPRKVSSAWEQTSNSSNCPLFDATNSSGLRKRAPCTAETQNEKDLAGLLGKSFVLSSRSTTRNGTKEPGTTLASKVLNGSFG